MRKDILKYTQNRELSWLKFNQRVLEEAQDPSVPLLERMKFVANSLLVGCSKVGVNVAVAAPKSLWPDEKLIETCKGFAEAAGSTVEVSDQLDVVEGADMLYTDVWFSMGEEKKEQERTRLALPYQVNAELMKRTGKSTTLFSHCLPANKGKEVTEDVFESEASVVFDEAENRLHTIKAIMVATLGD